MSKSKQRYFRQSLPLETRRQRCPDPKCRGMVKDRREKSHYRTDPACPETEVITFKYRCTKCKRTILETPKQGRMNSGVLAIVNK